MSTDGSKYKKSNLETSLTSTSPPIIFESRCLIKTVDPVYLNASPDFIIDLEDKKEK